MPFWSKRKSQGKKDRDVAQPDSDAEHGDPDSPPMKSGTEAHPEKYGLFFLNRQQFEDITKAGEARCSVDIVALHGLNGHAYHTWTHQQNGKLWLRDFLPLQLPGARIFTFGYPSEVVFSLATGKIADYARSLLEDLNSERRTPEVRNINPAINAYGFHSLLIPAPRNCRGLLFLYVIPWAGS